VPHARGLVAVLGLVLALTGCSSGGAQRGDADDAATAPSSSSSSSPSSPSSDPSSSEGSSAPSAAAVRVPEAGACYRLGYDQAVAPTASGAPVRCAGPHTAVTYAVGSLDVVVDGHLLAVDSRRVQEQVARTCPDRLAGFLGGSTDALRLSMLRSVWFTPTVAES
jgi:hypothetical protein